MVEGAVTRKDVDRIVEEYFAFKKQDNPVHLGYDIKFLDIFPGEDKTIDDKPAGSQSLFARVKNEAGSLVSRLLSRFRRGRFIHKTKDANHAAGETKVWYFSIGSYLGGQR